MGEAEFDCGDDGMRSMAIFCAQLLKEGIKFSVVCRGTKHIVKMTGY